MDDFLTIESMITDCCYTFDFMEMVVLDQLQQLPEKGVELIPENRGEIIRLFGLSEEVPDVFSDPMYVSFLMGTVTEHNSVLSQYAENRVYETLNEYNWFVLRSHFVALIDGVLVGDV